MPEMTEYSDEENEQRDELLASISNALRENFYDNSFIFEDRGDTAMLAHMERPFLGQPHTDHGERGKAEITGLRMRDIADCIARGFAQACSEKDTWTFDEHSVTQNAMCNVEKMMGIYPNVPPLHFDSKEEKPCQSTR